METKNKSTTVKKAGSISLKKCEQNAVTNKPRILNSELKFPYCKLGLERRQYTNTKLNRNKKVDTDLNVSSSVHEREGYDTSSEFKNNSEKNTGDRNLCEQFDLTILDEIDEETSINKTELNEKYRNMGNSELFVKKQYTYKINFENVSSNKLTVPKKRGKTLNTSLNSFTNNTEVYKLEVIRKKSEKLETLVSDLNKSVLNSNNSPKEMSEEEHPIIQENIVSHEVFKEAAAEVPKKRGRPKKSLKIESKIREIELDSLTVPYVNTVNKSHNKEILANATRQSKKILNKIEITSPDSANENNQNVHIQSTVNPGFNDMVVPTPLPKKMGYEKKFEKQQGSEVVEESVNIDKSRSERARKNMNDLKLVNEVEDQIVENIPSRDNEVNKSCSNTNELIKTVEDSKKEKCEVIFDVINSQQNMNENKSNVGKLTNADIECEDPNSEILVANNKLKPGHDKKEDTDSYHKEKIVSNTEEKVENKSLENAVPVVKKRGRPRKSIKTGNNNDLGDSSIVLYDNTSECPKNDKVLPICNEYLLDSTVNIHSEETVTPTPVPKKRGRKRKSEQVPEPLPVEEPIILDESRSGRKRKKVNYIELMNETDDNFDDEYTTKQKGFTDNLKKPQIGEGTGKNTSDSDVDEIKSNSNETELNKTEDGINKKPIRKRRKYGTGETVMTINSVFAAALKNKSNTESGSNSDEISQKTTEIVIDEENQVLCIMCNKKINNDEWNTHNKQEHNNLSWREGEQELILGDIKEVTKIIQPILEENDVITCKKCNTPSFKSVSRFFNHMIKCSGIQLSTDQVTCAVCKLEMDKSKWANHRQRQHNNLTWRVGDPPLDLNDKQLVLSILTALYKAKKPLYCEKCGTQKKSVLGFLSHQSQCGVEDAKVKCQFCDKRVLPISMQSHVKMIHETPRQKQLVQDSNYFNVDTNTPLSKRKAAKTAMMVINKISGEKVQEHSKYYLSQINFSEEEFVKLHLRKELSQNGIIKCKFSNCSYESDCIITVLEHMDSCETKPEQYFTCKRCISISNTEEEIKTHLKDVHEIDIIEDEYEVTEYLEDEDDYDEELKRTPSFKVKPMCIRTFTREPRKLFPQSYNYSMAFYQKNHSEGKLFKDMRYIKSDWLLLDSNLIEDYLPQSTQSCDVAQTKIKQSENILGKDYSFKKFDLLETEFNEGIVTIYCGGPIQALAWLPTPYNTECRQVLAVAPQRHFDKKYLISTHYNEQSVIQFWDFGTLLNKKPMLEQKLMFCLAVDFGPVWHLEWCPSGCFDVKSEGDEEERLQMGLLAVAGSDSAVYIYSIPNFREEEMGLFYKAKPRLQLRLTLSEYGLNSQKYFATKISWSKVSGHNYISVGYTNGTVGLFNISSTSNLMRHKCKDGSDVLLPYKSFQPHSHIISVLDFVPIGDGKRWLLTGSYDRNITVWDLNTGFRVNSKRTVISDGIWLTNWMAFISTYDESCANSNSTSVQLSSYKDYLYERVNLTNSSSSGKSISSSCWLNGIIYSNSVGEVTTMLLPQLLYGLDNDKKLKNRVYTIGYTKLINKHLTPEERCNEAEKIKSSETKKKPLTSYTKYILETENTSEGEYEPLYYEEAEEKFGLLFCDVKMDNYNDLEKDKDVESNNISEESKANLYPLQSINKVAFNLNPQASLYYATGYQAGFVRVTYMKFLEKDAQIQ